MEEVSKSLCGRDCKVLAERAGESFPELLEYVMAPQQAVEEAARAAAAQAASSGSKGHATTSDVGDNVFTLRPGGVANDYDDGDADDPDAGDPDDDDDDDEADA
eukprot:1438556-Pleurochrysis_carterae.AAC.1